MRETTTVKRIMKAELSDEPVRLSYPEKEIEEARERSEEIIEEAKKASERIRRTALQGAERERQAAKNEAATIIASAKNERDKLFKETKAQAKKEAEEKVLEEFRPRIEEGVAGLEELIRTAESSMRECLEKHKDEMVELAVRIAERVIHRRSEEDQELVLRTACAALEKAHERQEVKIFVNPVDLKILEEFKAELFTRFDDLKTVKMDVDRRVDRGGVRVETISGMIDARIRTQVEEIIKGLIPEYEKEETAEGD